MTNLCSCSTLKKIIFGQKYNRSENFTPIDEKGYEKHFVKIAEDYLKTPGIKIQKTSARSINYLTSVYFKIVHSNELVLDKKFKPKFYIITDHRPFYFSLPGGYIFYSSGLFDKYLKNEEILISILAFQTFRIHKNIYYKRTIVPIGYITTEKALAISKISVKEKIEVAKWTFFLLKRSGFDGLAYLQWLQIQNKYTLDFSLMSGNARDLVREEFLFKNFVVTEGDISRDYDIDERNSSIGFYRLQKEIRRSLETRII